MKRLFTSAALFLCSLLTFAQFSGSGSGTESDPYLILNPIQLNQLRNFLNQDGVYFKLMADIDLTEFLEDENPDQGWQPVGTSSAPFKGVLDGNDHIISGLWINRINSDYVGFFGCVNGATIKNLTLSNSSVEGSTYVGVLSAHSMRTTISECVLSGSISGVSYVGGCIGWGKSNTISSVSSTIEVTSSGDYAGGIIGHLEDNTIVDCSVVCNNISGVDYVGGICGCESYSGNQITRCHVEAKVKGHNYVGGVLGYGGIFYGNMISCSFSGSVDGTSFVGGICGKRQGKTTIQGCYVVANISSSGDNVGGLIGETYPYDFGNHHELQNVELLDSYFCGNVSGNNYVGGLIGHAYHGKIGQCYSYATINGTKSVGGLIGRVEAATYEAKYEITSNFAICTSIKATEGNIGKIFGERGKNVIIGEMGTNGENKAFNRTIVINAGVVQDVSDDEQNGTGVSATTLKLKATYVAMGWDFTDTWDIQETECYPYFKTQTAPPVITSQVISGATTVSGKCVDGGIITLEIDGVKQQMVSTGNTFSFTVSPLQAGHEVRVSAKAEGKEQSYYTTEVVSFLGKGTEAAPYQISTAADLTQVYRKGYYKLMNDIDLTSYINQFRPTEGWQSIGRDGSETIHFDGYGHKITGLWCNSTRDNTGLFSCFANGEIKNLTVETAKNKQVKGGANTGIIIGKMMNGTIENCVASGSVADGTPVGGIVGLMDDGTISKCQANVTINTAGAKTYVGGIVGEITGGKIDQCFTQGTLTATGSESYAAGLVGKNSATVADCYTNTTITSSHNAAGVVAYNYGVVEKCYATGNLFSSNYAAGIIGYNDGANAVVKNCAAMNNKIDVTYESLQQQQGGGYGQRIIGGIKNGAPAPELNNYALKSMQVSVNNVAQKVYDDIMNGAGKNGSDLLKTSTYQELGWDFTNTWNIKEGENYPLLKNNSGTVVKPGEDPTPEPDPDSSTKVDVTDITALTDAIYVNALTTLKGGSAVLTVCLKNAQPTNAYSFDLLLPERVSLAEDNEGNYLYELSSRHNGHSETVNDNATKGVYSFAVLSLQSKEVKGNDGAIWKLHLKIDDDMPVGDYAVKIQNAKYSTTSGSAKVSMPETISILTIEDHKKGDVNGDGDVDIADAVCIVNNVVGKTTPKYIAIAADVNGDGDVDIADAVRIVNLVVGKIGALAPQFVFSLLDPQ